jgi:lactoylglutathione lyase
MKIEHVAIWTIHLDELKEFYETYFAAKSSTKYVNERKQFESYFLTFPSGETRLELMRVPVIKDCREGFETPFVGYIHLAISVGSKEKVDSLTAKLREDGYTVVSFPRYTGDGYYESVILDPEENRLEITI